MHRNFGTLSRTCESRRMPAPRPHASPGLLCRRYSVPETIMRKYRLAQQRSDSEESEAAAARWSAASACPSPQRLLRRDRELMRKSALLRRTRARPCLCAEAAHGTRSLDGSRSELSSPRGRPWASPKRQRLDPPAGDFSDSTSPSHCPGRELCSCVRAADAAERPPAGPDSDTLSASVSTAKEPDPLSLARRAGCVSERSTDIGNEDCNTPSYERQLVAALPCPARARAAAPAPLYEMLEIVVSESAQSTGGADTLAGDSARPPRDTPLALRSARDIDIDEYVSNILVESLNSLTDQLETMTASIGGHRRVSIVEKEIKVRLQNAGVNTIVHLSPTSNNQIIFGNEELCSARDACDDPLSVREDDERDLGVESNGNLTSSAGSGAPAAVPAPHAFLVEPPLQRDGVNRAVLHQIQKLFRDELRGFEEGDSPPPPPGVSHVEMSNVDAYLAAHGAGGAPRPELQIATHADGDLIAGVGAGNYFRDERAAAVPRFSAFPHTDSMEVNTSSSSEGDAACSDCTSLVDSLDDPNSPRAPPPRRLARSAVDVLELLPERVRDASAESRGEAFFVRIEDDDLDPEPVQGNVRVAECMPEKIKQRLYQRHRKREMRMESARRSKVKQLKRELERRRLEEAAAARRDLERDCMAIVNALIDDVVSKIAQDEYKCMRIERRNGKPPTAGSEDLARRVRRRDLEALDDREDARNARRGGSRRSSKASNKENRKSGKNHIHGKLLARPSLTTPARPPRRLYQKSEIHEGEKCIEILEILEYVNGSQSSSETTNSDESHAPSTRCKKSRIPVPVYERMQRTTEGEGRALAGGPLRAPAESPPAPAPAPPEPRSRSNSLRFKRVFDMIPEERSSLSFESSAEDAEIARRASAPEVPGRVAPPSTRSAGTSPPADPARALRSQNTMTSPCTKSAATSPLRHGAPPAPPRPAREGRDTEHTTTETEKAASRPPAGEWRAPSAGSGDLRSRRRGSAAATSSSDSGDSGGSLLCSLAPRWLSSHARQRRRARRSAAAPPAHLAPAPAPAPAPLSDQLRGPEGGEAGSGGWTVTVAGSCRAALPADVEMRLRFPADCGAPPPAPLSALSAPLALSAPAHQECRCVQCARCAAAGAALPAARHRASPARARAPAPAPAPAADSRLTLTMKKEAQDSSILASKSVRKSSELPELETYRASRTKTKSSVKTRRAYSLHCWLPDDAPAPIRGSDGLSVLGCAIIPELKPRVPTMSERDLTRVYTPRHYLRS